MGKKRLFKGKMVDLRTVRRPWQLVETTKGGMGGNWSHTSYFHYKADADAKAKKARNDLAGTKRSLARRHIKFTYSVKVEKRPGTRG